MDQEMGNTLRLNDGDRSCLWPGLLEFAARGIRASVGHGRLTFRHVRVRLARLYLFDAT